MPWRAPNFELKKGEHVAIMGDNGAGKSTFVRQITGVEQRTRGKIWLYGEEVSFAGPLDAREAGIETVFQTLALADDLDVPDNLFLGREKTKLELAWAVPAARLQGHARRRRWTGLKRPAVKIPNIRNTIRNMSGGQRQCVAIARTATFHSTLDDHGRADGGAGRAGNRAGGKHHPHAERGRASR